MDAAPLDTATAALARDSRTRLRRRGHWRFWHSGPQGSDTGWALAFLIPYTAVFLLFVVYPVLYGLWLGHAPSSYQQLFADPVYLKTVVNTLIYLAIGVNLHLFGALMLSGFFMRRNWRGRSLLLGFIPPPAGAGGPPLLSLPS